MTTSRPIDRVLEAIYKQIPPDFKYKITIRIAFDEIISSTRYTAPEAMCLRWNQTAEILMDYIPEPKLSWQTTIAKLFSGELDYLEYLSDRY